MGLKIIHLSRVDTCLRIQFPQQQCLGVTTRNRQPIGTTIAIDPGRGNLGINEVAIRASAIQLFENKYTRAFGAHVAVTRRVKDVADTSPRQHRSLGKSNKGKWVQMQ